METNYRRVINPINSNLYSVQNDNYKWGVIDENNNVIVPFGKYSWIDGFQNGLAKVIGHNDETSPTWTKVDLQELLTGIPQEKRPPIIEQGIINETGEEVLPMERGYKVWKFYGKRFATIKTYKDGREYKFSYY